MATNTNYNNMIKYYATPWDIAFELAKEDYTKEHIDDMLLCEIQEIIEQYSDED